MAAVAQVTTYSELQDHVADTLNRTDLTTPITTFIQMAEEELNRDMRVRKLQDLGTLSVSADGTAMPTDLRSVESWYHDGPTFRGPIEVVNADMIGHLKRRYGATGAPAFAAILGATAIYAPVPDDTFLTKFIYWRKIDLLTTTNTTNWLLDDHADIYIYATLMETAPYLKADNRIQTWSTMLEKRLESLHQATEDQQFSGTLRRQFKPIG